MKYGLLLSLLIVTLALGGCSKHPAGSELFRRATVRSGYFTEIISVPEEYRKHAKSALHYEDDLIEILWVRFKSRTDAAREFAFLQVSNSTFTYGENFTLIENRAVHFREYIFLHNEELIIITDKALRVRAGESIFEPSGIRDYTRLTPTDGAPNLIALIIEIYSSPEN
jgi:hypothetical protein